MSLFLKSKRFKKSLLGQLQSTLRLVDLRDVVQGHRDHDIGLARCTFEDGQRATINLESLRLSQLTMPKIAQLHARQRRIEMIGAQGFFVDADRAQGIPFGVFQSVLAQRDLAKNGEYGGDVSMT